MEEDTNDTATGQTENQNEPVSQNTESRVLDVFGPIFIETNGAVGVWSIKISIYSVTGNGVVYQQALYENGLSAIRAEKTLEIQTGIKNKANEVSLHL